MCRMATQKLTQCITTPLTFRNQNNCVLTIFFPLDHLRGLRDVPQHKRCCSAYFFDNKNPPKGIFMFYISMMTGRIIGRRFVLLKR